MSGCGEGCGWRCACRALRGVAWVLDRAAPGWRERARECLATEDATVVRDGNGGDDDAQDPRPRIAVGWCSDGGTFLPNAQSEVMLFAATLDARCVYVRGDSTDPAIDYADFDATLRAAPAFNADLLLLAGHGSGPGNGFELPNGNTLNYRTARFGGSLRWVVLDSCLSIPTATGIAWAPSFAGIHALLGHDTLAVDSAERGRILAARLNEGMSVIEAWQEAVEGTSDDEQRWSYMVPSANEAALTAETLQSRASIEIRYDAFSVHARGV